MGKYWRLFGVWAVLGAAFVLLGRITGSEGVYRWAMFAIGVATGVCLSISLRTADGLRWGQEN